MLCLCTCNRAFPAISTYSVKLGTMPRFLGGRGGSGLPQRPWQRLYSMLTCMRTWLSLQLHKLGPPLHLLRRLPHLRRQTRLHSRVSSSQTSRTSPSPSLTPSLGARPPAWPHGCTTHTCTDTCICARVHAHVHACGHQHIHMEGG